MELLLLLLISFCFLVDCCLFLLATFDLPILLGGGEGRCEKGDEEDVITAAAWRTETGRQKARASSVFGLSIDTAWMMAASRSDE